MFNKVMWATDGSAAADEALPIVRMLAEQGQAEVLVVHCEEIVVPEVTPAHADAAQLKSKVEAQVDELLQAGVRASLNISRAGVGGAAHAIADVAKSAQADLIVAGTRGHTGLGSLLVGSVTQRLLHIAPCPILVVPGKHGVHRD